MGYKIGMDFGTTNSTVSYLKTSKEEEIEAFRFPGPGGYEYIPSCVAYDTDGCVHIGRAALDLASDPEATFCNNLKMILPLAEKDRSQFGWPQARKPEEAIADYFNHVLALDDIEASSFRTQKGPIDGLVLSVPHVWAKGMDHAGRSRLQSIVAERINLPLIQLISEPVAAAACYAHRYLRESRGAFRGNLLICDMGGGTFDVTLCKVDPGKVEELHNDGNGRLELGKAGVRFDRRLILEGLRKKGENIDENSPDFYDLYNKLQDYKVNNHLNITKSIINALDDPELRQKPILKAGKVGFNFDDIKEAFQEIDNGITEVLQRCKKGIEEKGYTIDAVFFVGGFCQFYLVRESIKRVLNIGQHDTRFLQDADKEFSRYAISYGAALIANDLMTVEEKYEHTIGLAGYVLERVGDSEEFMKKEVKIPIIKGGRKLAEYDKVQFAEYPVKAHAETPDIVIFVDPESRNRIIKEKLPESLSIKLPNAAIPGNQWKVGMRINKSKIVYLVFEDRQGDRAEYELGDILRQIFSGLEILKEEGEEGSI